MKWLFLSIFLLFGEFAYSQTHKADYVAFRLYDNEKCEFQEWGEWSVSSSYISITPEKVVFFSAPQNSLIKEVYTIVTPIFIGYKEDIVALIFDVEDSEGDICTMEIIRFPNKINHLYIRYDDLQIVYQF